MSEAASRALNGAACRRDFMKKQQYNDISASEIYELAAPRVCQQQSTAQHRRAGWLLGCCYHTQAACGQACWAILACLVRAQGHWSPCAHLLAASAKAELASRKPAASFPPCTPRAVLSPVPVPSHVVHPQFELSATNQYSQSTCPLLCRIELSRHSTADTHVAKAAAWRYCYTSPVPYWQRFVRGTQSRPRAVSAGSGPATPHLGKHTCTNADQLKETPLILIRDRGVLRCSHVWLMHHLQNEFALWEVQRRPPIPMFLDLQAKGPLCTLPTSQSLTLQQSLPPKTASPAAGLSLAHRQKPHLTDLTKGYLSLLPHNPKSTTTDAAPHLGFNRLISCV